MTGRRAFSPKLCSIFQEEEAFIHLTDAFGLSPEESVKAATVLMSELTPESLDKIAGKNLSKEG